MSVFGQNVPPRTALLLAACALFVSVVLGREAQRAPPPPPPEARPAARDAPAPLELGKLERGAFAEPRANLFAPVAPRPAPRPARAAPAAPSPPAAPPLPFRYLGTYEDGGETAVFLARGDEPVRAEPGATLPGEYRVEALAADGVTLRYLPLGTVHRIPIPPRP